MFRLSFSKGPTRVLSGGQDFFKTSQEIRKIPIDAGKSFLCSQVL